MAKKDELQELNGEKGVWRTIGGRRVFIKTGQSLSDAMRKSGKFNNMEIKNRKKGEKEAEQYMKEAVDELVNDMKQDDFIKKIKDFDENKVAKDKWTAEEQFMVRMKDNYGLIKEKYGEQKAIESLKNTKIVAQNEDYLIYSTKGEYGYDIHQAKTYNRNSRIDKAPDLDYEVDYDTGKIKPGSAKVNWAAYGALDIDEAEEFAEKLNRTIKLARKLNNKK